MFCLVSSVDERLSNISGVQSHFVVFSEGRFPINLLRRMTIAIPEKKKRTGANRLV